MIRQATTEDRSAIKQIAERSWEKTYDHLIPLDVRTRFVAEAYSLHVLEQKINDSVCFLVAEDKDTLVGFAQLTRSEEETELAAIYLDPLYASKGIGSELVHAVLEKLHQNESLTVYLEEGNDRAEQFYKKHGFVFVQSFTERWNDHLFKTKKMWLNRTAMK